MQQAAATKDEREVDTATSPIRLGRKAPEPLRIKPANQELVRRVRHRIMATLLEAGDATPADLDVNEMLNQFIEETVETWGETKITAIRKQRAPKPEGTKKR